MKNLALILLFSLIFNILSAQKKKDEYFHPLFKQIAKNHQTMAVLPFKFNTKLLKKDLQEVTEDQIETMEKIDGQLFQSSVYDFLKKKEEGRGLKVELQNVNVTNEILEENSFSAKDVEARKMKEIAKILGVDVLVFGVMNTSEPFSESAALAINTATRIFTFGTVGAIANAHEANGVMQITDGTTGNLLWRYQIYIDKGAASSSEAIVEKVMKKSAKNIPYIGK
ncbi:MAG: hypothetical protein AAF363_19165 [Bacteroidota bacterium]